MKSKNGISIVIPTFRREKQVLQILNSLKNQKDQKLDLEIIICDSFSNYNLSNLKKYQKHLKISYYNIKKNNLSAKRNFGINICSYKNIILIDDDCIPDSNFIKNYTKNFLNLDENIILSGLVAYPEKYLNYNHIKFKSSRHFTSKDISLNQTLLPEKIVAMNMGIIFSKKFEDIGMFNESFSGYGFEDYEFANRYYSNGFQLKQTYATIIHDEGIPNIDNYIKKHYHLGRDGMKNLINVDIAAAKKTSYYKFENRAIINFLKIIPKLKIIILLLEKIIIKFDKSKYINFYFLFNLLRAISYLRGFIDRNKNTLKSSNWYE